ncbi:hypothetical protein HDU91_004907, partial [Kappamyces sp. JEL0680]
MKTFLELLTQKVFGESCDESDLAALESQIKALEVQSEPVAAFHSSTFHPSAGHDLDVSHGESESREEAKPSADWDQKWLLKYGYVLTGRKCQDHVQAFACVLDPSQLCIDVFTILRKTADPSEMQAKLVDLIGLDDLELLGDLVEQRDLIVKTIMAKAPYLPKRPETVQKNAVSKQTASFGTQITIMTQEEKDQQKSSRKSRKKNSHATDDEHDATETAMLLGLDGARLKRIREAQLADNAVAPALKPTGATAPKYPNVYQSGSGGSVLSMFGSQFVLPAGTQREDASDYEEITIPVATKIPPRSGEHKIFIDHFEEWIRPTFKGYTGLNRVQSIVYPIAFESNENMLVCAPTGAGKTDVAMLTVLRAISQFRQNNRIAKNDFKIVYVAPMKALAAEVTRKFGTRLAYLGIQVRELTGDMQMTKAEINDTQMIVTTPEKWDVVTRKSVGDTQLVQKVKLLIIDEVHLLHEGRGAVIESIVARTLRLVESQQSMIRIVGLSATLPNYVDVAEFLGVSLNQGLFFFDSGFRPVPLEQHFIGIKAKPGSVQYRTKLDAACYEKVSSMVRDGHQVMVFVHSRKDTVKSAQAVLEEAGNTGEAELFSNAQHEQFGTAWGEVQKSRNKELKELFASGLGIHHAGMLRSDRSMTERMFEKGLIKVLFCTATLAWGVNLPAYAVVIKGTSVYSAEKGSFMDLSILDVLQIFGRAGRPQFEDRGVGFILTSHDKLTHYVSSMTQQHPIESAFNAGLVNNLNAEIALGSVTTMDEAIKWLSYTYLYVRMKKNPFNYGMDWSVLETDPLLFQRRREILDIAATKLHKAQMIVYDART